MAFKKANPVKPNLFIQLMTLLLTWTVAKKSMPYISRLYSKQKAYSLSWHTCSITNFLEVRSQRVTVGDCYSGPSDVLSGRVPQETALAPLLICYVNELPNLVSSKIQLYADDILLFRI